MKRLADRYLPVAATECHLVRSVTQRLNLDFYRHFAGDCLQALEWVRWIHHAEGIPSQCQGGAIRASLRGGGSGPGAEVRERNADGPRYAADRQRPRRLESVGRCSDSGTLKTDRRKGVHGEPATAEHLVPHVIP